MSKTNCIVPWSTLVIGPDGRATFCCEVPEALSVDGRQGSIYRDSLDDLWNARELVEVRAAMARGERPAACRLCWAREAAGGVSRRLLTNGAYPRMGGRLAVEELTRHGAASGYRLKRGPDWFILELGNVCNLKCRSCSGLLSSRIAADPVQTAWAGEAPHGPAAAAATAATAADAGARGARRSLRIVPEGESAWYEDVEAVAEMIAGSAGGDDALLSLMGGEPFLIEGAWRLLAALVARGAAGRFLVGVATNGQQWDARLAEIAPNFRGFNLSLSIDAHGRLYEVLRHGAAWRKLVANLSRFKEVPHLSLTAVPTLQNGNALDMVTLLRFLDAQEIALAYNVATWPPRLSPANLPPNARRIAAARLRAYLDQECRPANVAVVRGYCEALEAAEGFDEALFREFMIFTNDLDASRGESLRAAAPELAALVRAAGIEWPGERRVAPAAAASRPPIRQAEVLARVNRTVSPRDVLFAGFEAVHAGAYFESATRQLAEVDDLLLAQGHPGIAAFQAVADFACHYGRLTRALCAALPHAAVYACDIDDAAVAFCAAELGALPVVTGWRPDEERLPAELDAVFCVSLLTHTPLSHWRSALRGWARMLRPGGVAAFTYLGAHHLDAWLAGRMEHYGSYADAARADVARAVQEEGHGFASLTSGYGGEPSYGVALATSEVVRREIAAAGLDLLALPGETSRAFGQDLALARRPEKIGTGASSKGSNPPGGRAARGEPGDAPALDPDPGPRRDVSLVALYDPRCYAAADGGAGAGAPAESAWARLTAARPPRPLPTELGFGDPRVPEVREAQAALAREHAVDAFCYLYPWGAAGPRWDAPWRDLVASGRPDLPFCLMVELAEEGGRLGAAAAARLLDDIAAGLADRRYLRLDGRPLLVVRGVAHLQEPRATASAWRAGAARRGLGELHLCAAEPTATERPEDLGFDSLLENPPSIGDPVAAAAAALARPWPQHRFFRTVACRRDAAGSGGIEVYEHWLRSTCDATRRRGERLVFVDSWNDWMRGHYLEPDDRDGRAALAATRRAARGPASGLVLLRQLRDALGGEAGGRVGALLGELSQVVALHEHARDRLLASVEALLGRNPIATPEILHWVPVASRHLPPSPGGFCLDRVGGFDGAAALRAGPEPLAIGGETVRVAGWAHAASCPPGEVDLFLALESAGDGSDRILRVAERVERLDVAAAFPGHPAKCGFDATVDLRDVPAGTYHIAIVQRTSKGTYRDATTVAVTFDGAGAACSRA